LSEYKISGEVARVTGLRTITQLVEGAFQRNVKTLVAVGTDETLHEVINAIKGREVTVGFIPLVPTELSVTLGLPSIEQAAKTIGLRRIADLDLSVVNGNYFLSQLTFGSASKSTASLSLLNFSGFQDLWKLPTFEIKFTADNNNFQASVTAWGGIVVNSRAQSTDQNMFNPTDGVLDVMLLPKLGKMETIKYRSSILKGDYEKIPGSSLVHVKQLEITTPVGLPLKVGEKIIARTPAQISVLPNALKIIVGRDRKYLHLSKEKIRQ
jgi:diacylglycerol kinase family enzyme